MIGTEFITISNKKYAPKLYFFIIPGNPGCSLFYINFMKQLLKQFNNKIIVSCASYPGHGYINIENALTLTELKNHYNNIFNYLYTTVHIPIVILSHSIGCYILQQLDIDKSRILRIYMMMPFLEIDKTNNYLYILKKIVSQNTIVNNILNTINYIPFLKKYISLKLLKTEQTHLLEILLKNKKNIISLAKEELQQLNIPNDLSAFEKVKTKMCIIGCNNDNWFSFKLFNTIKYKFPEIHTIWDSAISHTFILDNKELIIMTRHIWIDLFCIFRG